MWCANCRSDVAAEVSTDNRHVNCANCGGPIATPLSGRTLTRTQQARELLERWSQDRTPDAAAAAVEAAEPRRPDARPSHVYAIQREDEIESAAGTDELHREPPPQQRRRDDGHSLEQPSRPIAEASPASPRKRLHRMDSAHAAGGPHGMNPAKPPTRWVPLVGQSLAYIGVLGLMAGACLVILGYFRGPATYAPTGWLITMAGQMLLFLGVVTLVSTGMEETTNTVANRIDRLDEKLVRIEQATSQLRGPIGATNRTESDAAVATPPREISRAG